MNQEFTLHTIYAYNKGSNNFSKTQDFYVITEKDQDEILWHREGSKSPWMKVIIGIKNLSDYIDFLEAIWKPGHDNLRWTNVEHDKKPISKKELFIELL